MATTNNVAKAKPFALPCGFANRNKGSGSKKRSGATATTLPRLAGVGKHRNLRNHQNSSDLAVQASGIDCITWAAESPPPGRYGCRDRCDRLQFQTGLPGLAFHATPRPPAGLSPGDCIRLLGAAGGPLIPPAPAAQWRRFPRPSKAGDLYETLTRCQDADCPHSDLDRRVLRQPGQAQRHDGGLGRHLLLRPALCGRVAAEGHLQLR
jgi:hypothetical protein